MKLSIIFISLYLIACNDTMHIRHSHTLDFGSFSIETPNSWTKIKASGIDSYVGRIAIDNADTLDFDLGWYSNTLTEYEPRIVERSILINNPNIDTTDLIIVNSRKGVDPEKYKKNNVAWDTIDGRKSKIVYPRISGVGTTGIYIDSLWKRGSAVDRFNLYAQNLKPANEKLFFQALKTLKFKRLD